MIAFNSDVIVDSCLKMKHCQKSWHACLVPPLLDLMPFPLHQSNCGLLTCGESSAHTSPSKENTASPTTDPPSPCTDLVDDDVLENVATDQQMFPSSLSLRQEHGFGNPQGLWVWVAMGIGTDYHPGTCDLPVPVHSGFN